jgi:hypothetical protein
MLLYGTMRALGKAPISRYAGLITTLLIIWVCTLDFSYSYAPLNLMHWIHQPSLMGSTAHSRAQAAILRGIPADAAVDADPPLAAHLANRTYLFDLAAPQEALLAPYILLDLHADYGDPPAWLIGLDQQTLTFIRKAGGFRVWRADPEHGLYVYLNCGRFPATVGCGSR